MQVKIILYMLITMITVVAIDSLNINSIFKKGKVFGARIFIILISISIIYLVTNFIYDFATTINIF